MKDDFLPYASRSHTYWTGFYTSRSALKRYVRKTSNFLQGIRQLVSFTDLNDTKTMSALNRLERAMGVVQHHDAVSGTENQHVANDYSKRLAGAVIECANLLPTVLSNISGVKNSDSLFYCPLLNISECKPIENSNSMQIIVYNPLARQLNSWIRIPLVTNDYILAEENSAQSIDYQFLAIDSDTKRIPERDSSANFEIVFNARNLPALGFKVYNLKKAPPLSFGSKKAKQVKEMKNNFLKNEFFKITFDDFGNLLNINTLDTQMETNVHQKYCYYRSKEGDNKKGETQSSVLYFYLF